MPYNEVLGMSLKPGESTKLAPRYTETAVPLSMCANPTTEQLRAAIEGKVEQITEFLDLMRAMNPDGKTVIKLAGNFGTWVCTFEENLR